jgi:hypothetical protein
MNKLKYSRMKNVKRCLLFSVLLTATLGVGGVSAQPNPLNDVPDIAAPAPLAPVGNGTVALGINPLANLIDGSLGLTYLPTGNEALAVGCDCEGWGAADAGLGVFGYASLDLGGTANVAPVSFVDDGVSATSVVTVGGILEVTHDFAPSAATPNLYEIVVTMTNISGGDLTDVRYTRVMDWDANPTPFAEFITIQGTAAEPRVLYADNDGFTNPNPLGARSPIAGVPPGDVVDTGPRDQGSLFDFGLGALADGESVSFVIYYGAAGDEAGALAALAAVNANVYSLGQPSSSPPEEGVPNTFIFAFGNTFDKVLTSGPDRDGDGAIDVVVPINVEEPTAYDFTLYWNDAGASVLIGDTVPAEWDVTHVQFDDDGLPLDCGGFEDFAGDFGMVDIWRGGKPGKKCNSDTSFSWMPAGSLNIQTEARCHNNRNNQRCRPTSCGALYLNYGAVAYLKDPDTGEVVLDDNGEPIVVDGPTDPICLAAVDDVDGDGMFTWDGTGDEDADGALDYEEACGIGTDPCNPDTDGDGVLDGADECPLEGPADASLGEILDPNGCIRQSQCSDGIDNDDDGVIDFAGGDLSCDDILDDSEDTPDFETHALFADGPGYDCPTGATEFQYLPPLDPSSSTQAKQACEACYGVGACYLEDADCAGLGWGPRPDGEYVCGEAYFGFENGCSGSDGRAWRICTSFTTYGYWGYDSAPLVNFSDGGSTIISQ